MPVVFTIIALLIGFSLEGFDLALMLGLLTSSVSLCLHFSRKVDRIEKEMADLRSTLERDRKVRAVAKEETSTSTVSESKSEVTTSKIPEQQFSGPPPVPVQKASVLKEAPVAEESKPKKSKEPNSADALSSKIDGLIQSVVRVVKSYFTDGNLFVRVGILVLFFGVAFLLKYAAEHSKIPVEVRFIGAAIGGLSLLVFGWRLRLKKPTYGLLLQGAGIGVIYITIFSAYRLQHLIPSTWTFVLLAVFSIFSALLAVVQNARGLAAFGFLGGFLAPLLASSGSGNYVGLFSYYALLNGGLLFIAWFKAWRPLNLLGFAFTFVVFSIWVAFSYRTHMLMNAQIFLALFFLMYSLIGVLYAFKQPLALKGYVDGSLVFGTPMVASTLQMAMVRDTEYGIAISAAVLGFYYVFLTRFLWNRFGEGFRVLAEALLSVGVIFLTLAIPYALDSHWTTATWALEASGVLWIAIRQKRKFTQYFAVVLQLAAGVLFLASNANDFGDKVFVNPAFIGGLFIALGALVTSWQLYKLKKVQPKAVLVKTHVPFFIWGMCWWLISASLQIERYFKEEASWIIGLFTLTAFLLMHLSVKRKWNWRPADVTAMLLVPTLGLIGLGLLADHSHALMIPEVLLMVPAMAASYYILLQMESQYKESKSLSNLYLMWATIITLLVSVEVSWRFDRLHLTLGDAWGGVVIAIFPLLVMHVCLKTNYGALGRFGVALKHRIIGVCAFAVALWSLCLNFTNAAETYPIPYMPVLNPIDVLHVLFILFAIRFTMSLGNLDKLRKRVIVFTGVLGFIWLNCILLRSLYHYVGIPYDIPSMSHNITVQISISILWTILGMLAMLLASRKQLRTLWIVGGSLVAIVLVKMVTIDLGASGTIERIISFLVVGSLLVTMGYFSPIPEKLDKKKEKGNNE